ncbi:hypothetical protein O6H91_Y276300 [Diphasiastrum complanatum]|nr:hypothetical protein O6H91_Y276300 [Diphasiastrum complanatum]
MTKIDLLSNGSLHCKSHCSSQCTTTLSLVLLDPLTCYPLTSKTGERVSMERGLLYKLTHSKVLKFFLEPNIITKLHALHSDWPGASDAPGSESVTVIFQDRPSTHVKVQIKGATFKSGYGGELTRNAAFGVACFRWRSGITFCVHDPDLEVSF